MGVFGAVDRIGEGALQRPQRGPQHRARAPRHQDPQRHDLRRTFGAACEKLGFTDRQVKRTLGHGVAGGETVRFVVTNKGKFLHEMVIGDKKTLDGHAALMVKFPAMEHDEPYMAHVPSGKTKILVWTFNQPGAFEFACLIAGHYQAGMVGKINVAKSGT